MFKETALLGLMTAILLAIGWFFGGIWGMGLGLALAFIINFVSYWYSDKIVLNMYKAELCDDRELNAIVAKLAQEAKIPKPALYIVPTDVPNAFATGRSPKHAALAVTKGLLNLNKEEIEGVLSHEIGHIKNRDILISTMAAMIAGAISYFAQIGYFVFLGGGEGREASSSIGLILILIFAPIAALLIRLSISRTREYKADYTGAILTKKPEYLASALKKINDMVKHSPMRGGSAATSHLWIVNPFKDNWFTGMFSTHPPLERRIKRLVEMKE